LGHLIRNALGIVALWILSLIPTGVRPQISQQQQFKAFQDYERQQAQLDVETHSDWMISHFDLQQNQELGEIEGHLRTEDTNTENLRNKHEALAREVSERHGEQTVWFGIISAGLVATLGLAVTNMFKLRKPA
jgi:hypothetical protein